jgi:hypothetical protein
MFGETLVETRTSAYLLPGTGSHSLATIEVPSHEILFDVLEREGADESDVRARMAIPNVGARWLPVKDHWLLTRIERTAGDRVIDWSKALRDALVQMGPTIAVRVGLSRGFDSGQGTRRCWLMADGFFAAEEVQL